MIIERKFDSGLRKFSEIGLGECFETQIGVDNTGIGVPYVDANCDDIYIKIPEMMDTGKDCDDWTELVKVYNAINLKSGMPKTIHDDDWVIKRETKLFIS